MQPHDDDLPSEQQLRDLYDTDEIDRFLSLFSAHVSEVHIQDDHAPCDDEEEPHYQPSTLSEHIAARYILPRLPKNGRPAPLFTLGRLRLNTERLYLSTWPVYAPFLSSLSALARWEDQRRSLIFCSMYWVLWYYNLLLPSLVLRVLYSLLRRKLWSYPTLAELNAHREQIDRSNEFGRELTARFSATSSLGIRELWRLFRVFNKPKKTKAKKLAGAGSQESLLSQEATTVFDSDKVADTSEENDVKRLVLKVMAEIADLHERVKNIFIWRRPASSRVYAIVVFIVFLVTLLVPTKYLAKLVYFVLGFLYWHVIPVIAALPPSERAKLPPAFSDAPSDAEYAMELISRRVAAGLDVRPSRSRNVTKGKEKERDQDTISVTDSVVSDSPTEVRERDANWKKWAGRAQQGKNLVEDGRRMLSGSPSRSRSSLVSAVETHTFPAQHTSAPGLITLTADKLYFSSLVSKFTLEIPLSSLRGVKKSKKHGLFNSLLITWAETESGAVRQEKFLWVGARDELFARLVGTADGKRLIAA
uniref:GRAM domain-containing protein n=1 Tax=Mycena chlorophos TaxID=658473 RepID=A0ABQ0KZ28_MYCCL|nr:predicted protein [Mycena chlorophos]